MADIVTPKDLLRCLAAQGERSAILAVHGDDIERLSFAGLAEGATRLALGLLQSGLAAGEPVALYAPNSPAWVIARLGVAAAGGLAAPFDDLLPETEVAVYLRDSACRRLFTTEDHADALAPHCGGLDLDILLLDDREGERSWRRLLSDHPGDLPEIAPDTPAMVVYTSGTTGKPKSFLLSYANLATNSNALVATNLIGPGDRVFLPLPLDNVYPYVVGLLTPLSAGASIVFPEAISGPAVTHALKLSRASVMIGVPRLYAALVAGLNSRVAAQGRLARWTFERLLALSIALQRHFGLRAGRRLFRGVHARLAPDLRMLVCGGARLESALIWTLEGLGWDVRGGYGLAEVGSVFIGNTPGQKRIGSEGKPIHSGQVRIATPDAEGIGEVQLKGTSVFAGYRDNPEANSTAFTDDGWFRTGDLGRLDDEGFLVITGRAKEMIVLGGGKNVFPEELEKVYATCPYAQELAVLEQAGALVAVVLPDIAAVQASGYTRVEDALRVSLAELGRPLPAFQRLSGIAILREPLPRTRLGKFRRFLLPALYLEARRGQGAAKPVAMSDEDRALLARQPAGDIWALLQARYPDAAVALDANPQLDLGIDSLEWLSLALELERRFRLTFSEEEIADLGSLRELLVLAQDRADRDSASSEEREAAPDSGAEEWLKPAGPLWSSLGTLLHVLNWSVMRGLFRLRAEGQDALPADGPCLLVANHASDLDPLALAAALPPRLRRQVHWGGDAVRLFSGGVLTALARALHIFPVDEKAPAASLARAARVLDAGAVLAWFPESWRSPDGKLQRFFPGVGRLVSDFAGPVIPVYISGTFEAMPRWRRVPRPHPIRVRFGTPLLPARLQSAKGGDSAYQEITALLRSEVAALSDQAEDEQQPPTGS